MQPCMPLLHDGACWWPFGVEDDPTLVAALSREYKKC